MAEDNTNDHDGLDRLRARLQAHPDDLATHKALIDALIEQRQFGEAEQVIDRARQIAPADVAVRLAEVRVNNAVGQYADADAAAQHVPADQIPRERLLQFTPGLVQTADVDKIDALGDVFSILEQDFATESLPHAVGTPLVRGLNTSAERIARFLRLQRQWTDAITSRARAHPIAAGTWPTRDRIRLAFFGLGNIGLLRNLLLPLLQRIDRSRFEVRLYFVKVDNQRVIDDELKPMSRRIDKVVVLDDANPRQLAQRLANEQIDILIEVNGLQQAGTRLAALAWKPAKVQMTWAGTPTSCGLPALDYQILDPYLVPQEPDFSIDRALELPRSWVCYGAMPAFESATEPPSSRNGYVTYAVNAAPMFINSLYLETCAAIIAADPSARLVFTHPKFGQARCKDNVRRVFERHGVDQRVAFWDEPLSGREHLRYYNEVDVLLDRFPIGGGIGTIEAMYMGVAPVAWYGPAVHTRMAYSQLHHCGIGDLCVDTPQKYRDQALQIGRDVERRRSLRASLRATIDNDTTFTHLAGFMSDFHAKLEEVVATHLA